ncbi:coiled-coil domain-containing protein 42-like isoform X2 [Coccinella septempunctata]|uniref:coiled-coil domain-containing protein 42-like isoform X2 n=1 Tax=Coccinella septempunctata TaxID=41139 RepID=UPI001D07AD5C|nr:coiled-coil domain-containing protein 42-like isoform X2 [Coccinella septempunctata]
MERQTPAIVDQEEKLGRDLKSATERWRWRFNLPQKPNYNNVYYYKKSKKIFNAPCYDLDMDKPPDSYKGEFLQVKNTLHHTEYRLKRAQEEARNKKQHLIQQWQELEIKEAELKNNFVQFNKFLGRNITKRKRAEQKFQEMQAMREECTEKIRQMKMDSEKIKEYVESTKEMIETHKIYGNYLNSVVMTGSFKTIHHIINRYIVLEETKQNVANKVSETSEEYHNRRAINEKQLESSQMTFLSLSNELSELRRKYDDAKKRSNAWERVLNDICNKYAAVAENLSWSRMALRHMFDMAFFRVRRRRRRLIKTKKDDLGKMLRINETLKALGRIEAQLRKLYGQQSVDTSMDPIKEDFGIKVEVVAPKSPGPKAGAVMGKWKGKKKRRVHMSGGEGDVEDYTESPDDTCPIKLARDKWKYANVRNFGERYKEALLGIQEEKLREKMRKLTYEPLIEKERAFVPGLSPDKLPRIKIRPVRGINQKAK